MGAVSAGGPPVSHSIMLTFSEGLRLCWGSGTDASALERRLGSKVSSGEQDFLLGRMSIRHGMAAFAVLGRWRA